MESNVIFLISYDFRMLRCDMNLTLILLLVVYDIVHPGFVVYSLCGLVCDGSQ